MSIFCVPLPNQHNIINVLKNKTKLYNLEKLKHISFFTLDFTSSYTFQTVLDELNTRKTAGENNLILK